MQRQEFGQTYRTAVLCVDSYQDGVLQGRFYHPYHQGVCRFQSLSQFLLQMEQTLEEMAYPQSFTAVRSFSSTPPPRLRAAESQHLQGDLATFSIRILFRQNASWQGSLRWLEQDKEESFRSALEMIFLMDSVLSEEEKGRAAG